MELSSFYRIHTLRCPKNILRPEDFLIGSGIVLVVNPRMDEVVVSNSGDVISLDDFDSDMNMNNGKYNFSPNYIMGNDNRLKWERKNHATDNQL